MTAHLIRAISIPADAAAPVTVDVLDGSEAGLSRAVGGGFHEAVFLPTAEAVLYCNADGKSRDDLAPNRRATQFVDRYVPGFAKADVISGPTVVVGLGADGSTQDVSDTLAETARNI